MRKVVPFESYEDALTGLAGGEATAIRADPRGGTLTMAHLRKAASVMTDDRAAILHFALATAELEEPDRDRLFGKLDRSAGARFEELRPGIVAPSNVPRSIDTVGRTFIVSGSLKLWRKEDFAKPAKRQIIPVAISIVMSIFGSSLYGDTDETCTIYKMYDDETHSGDFCLLLARPNERVRRNRSLAAVATEFRHPARRRWNRRKAALPDICLEPLFAVPLERAKPDR